MKKILGLILVLTAISTFGLRSEAVEMRVAGAYTSTTVTTSTTQTGVTVAGGSAQPGYGGGVLADFNLGPKLMLEVGGVYVTRKGEVKITSGGFTAVDDDTFTDIQVPAILKLKLGDHFAVGLGAVYNFAVGNVSVDQSDPNGILGGNFTGKSQTYAQVNNQTSDLAGVAAIDIHFPIGAKAGFFIEGQYQLGLTNVDTSGNQPTKINVIEAQAGVSFML